MITSFDEWERSEGGRVSSLQLTPAHLDVLLTLLYLQTTNRRPLTSQAQPLGERDTVTSAGSKEKLGLTFLFCEKAL